MKIIRPNSSQCEGCPEWYEMKIIRPNSNQCEGCPDWDDVNGCWANVNDVDLCTRIGEDGYYDINEEYIEDDCPLEDMDI